MDHPLRRVRRKTAVGAVALAASLVLTMSACSSSAGDTQANGNASTKVPDSALISSGNLTFCSDLSSPPLEFYDANNNPTGSDVELGDALAAKLGLTPVWSNTSFDGIIPALQAQRCDVIMSQLYIKPERQRIVDFVPYMYSGSTFLVKKSGGASLSSAADLCGKKAAAETGTTVVDFLQQQSAKCQQAGKPKIDLRQFTQDPAALQQLKIGLVDAYGTTVESAAYIIKQNPGQFAMAGQPFNKIKVGAATRKGNTALHDALAKALVQVRKDGQYKQILDKWGLGADSLQGD